MAVVGDAENGKAVIISSVDMPSQHVSCHLPAALAIQDLVSLSWSPAAAEVMLLLAFSSGAITTLSMSGIE